MTEQHVLVLLGEPTRRDAGAFFCEGETGNFGVVRGTVWFSRQGMYQVDSPAFIPLPE
jgi:hypothetical protein